MEGRQNNTTIPKVAATPGKGMGLTQWTPNATARTTAATRRNEPNWWAPMTLKTAIQNPTPAIHQRDSEINAAANAANAVARNTGLSSVSCRNQLRLAMEVI